MLIVSIGDEWSDRMFVMAFSESSHAIAGISCEELRKFFMLVCYIPFDYL